MITAIEDDLIARIRARFGKVLRTVDSLPGALDDLDTLHKMVRAAPAVFVLFAGGRNPRGDQTPAQLDGRWVFYAVTAHAGGQMERRRGDGRQVGAYEIVQTLVPLLHTFAPGGESELVLSDIANLYSGTLDERGVVLYAVTFVGRLELIDPTPAALDDFLTFHADHDLAPADGTIDATSDVTLPR